MQLVILVAFLGFITGCSFEEGPALPESSALKAYLDPKPEPNHYEVKLRWAIPETGPSWVVHRQEDDKSPVLLSTLAASANEYTDSNIVPGKKHKYQLGALTEGNYEDVAATSIMVPKDMEVKDRLVISRIEGVGRLFLSKTAHLVSEGKDAAISVDEIISENGVVESFSEGAQAPLGEAGRNGGLITIKARRGRGNLIVHARGENGGMGIPGANGVNGKKGQEGRYALGTHNSVDVVCGCGQRARELREAMKQGNIFAMFQFNAERARHRCISQPTDGSQGEAGTAGAPGSHGGKGGNSAKAFVEIEDPSQIQVDVFVIPGKGGTGGPGGIGGRGGPGGNPGSTSLDYYSNCREPQAGPPGQNAANGKPGLPGIDGTHEPFCLRLGNIKSPDCNKF
ncbi:MAG: hypothetical protein H6617_05875 [Bdellovibrionaceae bacterium]|nr:hypothetical protein [Bdellovibrionales bacterium]MCB9254194.1 hypothetical protein [Pseudobdellovibrionaceae bacterium]